LPFISNPLNLSRFEPAGPFALNPPAGFPRP
jgi:hypothetical protein